MMVRQCCDLLGMMVYTSMEAGKAAGAGTYAAAAAEVMLVLLLAEVPQFTSKC